MEKKKMNDKGFSLVELIIVIAIMAILIGVLAPQYLKFVERSRKSTDVQNVDEVVRAVEIYLADPSSVGKTDAQTITISGSGYTCTVTADDEVLASANLLDNALYSAGLKGITLKSSKWGTGDIKLTFTYSDNGTVTVTETGLTSGLSLLEGTYK